MTSLLLGIDVGTTATKAVLVTPQGHVVSEGRAQYTTDHLAATWVEQNPEEWWRTLCAATLEAIAKVPDVKILGVAISSQAPTFLAVDKDGKPLRPALIWMDRRAEAEAQEIANAKRVLAKAGVLDAKKVEPKVEAVEALPARKALEMTLLTSSFSIGKSLVCDKQGTWTKDDDVKFSKWFTQQIVPCERLKQVYNLLRKCSNHTIWVAGVSDEGSESLDACGKLARSMMPVEFHNAAFIVQATSGHALSNGKIRIRLFFALDKALTTSQMKSYAESMALKVDLSIYKPEHTIFLGSPMLINENGVGTRNLVDPVKDRWHYIEGEAAVKVPETLPTPIMARDHERPAERAENAETDTEYMIQDFAYLIERQGAKKLKQTGSRSVTTLLFAHDGFDRDISEGIVKTMLWAWASFEWDQDGAPLEDHNEIAQVLRDTLTDVGVRYPDDVADCLRNGRKSCSALWYVASREPFTDEKIDSMVEQALYGRHNAVGNKWRRDPTLAFGIVDDEEVANDNEGEKPSKDKSKTTAPEVDLPKQEPSSINPPKDAKREPGLVSLRELRSRGAYIPEWIVKGILPRGVIVVIWGSPGSTKTAFLLSIAFSMATGVPWLDGTVIEEGGTLFVAMESQDDTENMLLGCYEHHAALLDDSRDYPLLVYEKPLSLFPGKDKASIDLAAANEKKIIRLAKEFKEKYGVACKLIVLDTLQRTMLGGNQSRPEDVALISSAVDRIAKATGATVIALHHSIKGGASMRGSEALVGDFHGTLHAQRGGTFNGRKLRPDQAVVMVDRLKGVKAGSYIRYKTVEPQIGVYADGDPLKTFVAVADDVANAFGIAPEEGVLNADAAAANTVTAEAPSTTETDINPKSTAGRVLAFLKGKEEAYSLGQIREAISTKRSPVTEDMLKYALRQLMEAQRLVAEGSNRGRKYQIRLPFEGPDEDEN